MSLALALLMTGLLFSGILAGFPVMFVLLSVAFFVGGLGTLLGAFDPSLFGAVGPRLLGLFDKQVLYAIPLFVLLGKLLEHSRMIEELFAWVLQRGTGRTGTLVLVLFFSIVLAASSGLVGASIVILASIAFPALRSGGFKDRASAGLVCAAGTLGQLIPPSIVLILLADQIAVAYQAVQLEKGNFAPDPVTVGHLFAGALIPGLLLALLYGAYAMLAAPVSPTPTTAGTDNDGSIRPGLVGVAALLAVPASIISGVASPTEAASLGILVIGIAIAFRGMDSNSWKLAIGQSLELVGMIMGIIIGATVFALVFRGIGGDRLIIDLLPVQQHNQMMALSVVLLGVFVLGFVLEFVEITYLVVPVTAPVLLAMDVDPVWLGVLIGVVLQASFLTPPMGVSLFYFKSASGLPMTDIYKSVIPFIMMQLVVLAALLMFPGLGTWLPEYLLR